MLKLLQAIIGFAGLVATATVGIYKYERRKYYTRKLLRYVSGR